MTPALRWAAMGAILIFINCEEQSHKTVTTDHKLWRERRAEGESNRGPSVLPLGQTGWHTCSHWWTNFTLRFDDFCPDFIPPSLLIKGYREPKRVRELAWKLLQIFPSASFVCFCRLAWRTETEERGGRRLLQYAGDCMTRPMRGRQALPLRLRVKDWSGVDAEGSRVFRFVPLSSMLTFRVSWTVASPDITVGCGGRRDKWWGTFSSLCTSSLVPLCHSGQWPVLYKAPS